MKCREESDLLMSSHAPSSGNIGNCNDKFCQSCFKRENKNTTNCTFTCPRCRAPYYDNIKSIDEAILIGEATNIRARISPQLLSTGVEMSDQNITSLIEMNEIIIEKVNSALLLNPSSFLSLYSLFRAYGNCHRFLISYKQTDSHIELYRLKALEYAYKLIDHPVVSGQYEFVRTECYFDIASIFLDYQNWSAAHKYAKLTYEHCLRSPRQTHLNSYKEVYLQSRSLFAALPPLRFAVGDEVEFLVEEGSTTEWKLAKVVELYYLEKDFDVSFTAPYRLQLLEVSLETADQPPVYAWVKADIDRYIRKVGVRSIEDTRYQTRLDAKVAELARVYCSKEFIQGIHDTLVKDSEFCDMLYIVWHIELSANTLHLYRLLVMYRQPLVRTDSGYHVPTAEEVIAEFKAYFDLSHLLVAASGAGPSVASEDSTLRRVREEVLTILRGNFSDINDDIDSSDIQGHLLCSIKCYISMLSWPNSSVSPADLLDRGRDFTVPLATSEAIANVSTMYDLARIDVKRSSTLGYFIEAWIWLHTCLEKHSAGPACECPFVYFFVKFCLDQNLGVPKLALAVYDRMNMQLSREFIRCANPTCELNKLDESTGKVKFRQCSRCKAVIYCGRECQVAHYPEHKRLCLEHVADR